MASHHKIEAVSPQKFLFGESPLWDHRDGKLYFVDCFDVSLCCFDPKTKNVEKKRVDKNLTCISLAMPVANSSKRFLVPTNESKLVEFDWESGKISGAVLDLLKTSENGWTNVTRVFSDGKCDAKGRFWIGSEEVVDIAKLEVIKDQGLVHKFTKSEDKEIRFDTMASGFDIPNGLGWNKENDKLFYCDLVKRVVNVFDFDLNEGTITNRKTLFEFNDYPTELGIGMPDGLTVDLDGNVYVACWKAGCVIKIDGQTGKLLEKLPIPVTNTTSCVFGDEGFGSLYVTTTSVELDLSEVQHEPDAGKLFRITNPKDNRFKGFQQNFLNY